MSNIFVSNKCLLTVGIRNENDLAGHFYNFIFTVDFEQVIEGQSDVFLCTLNSSDCYIK